MPVISALQCMCLYACVRRTHGHGPMGDPTHPARMPPPKHSYGAWVLLGGGQRVGLEYQQAEVHNRRGAAEPHRGVWGCWGGATGAIGASQEGPPHPRVHQTQQGQKKERLITPL